MNKTPDLFDAPYYNTTNVKGAELAQRKVTAGTQDAAVLAFFEAHPNEAFTRDEIHRRVLPAAQNTSITRALNTLMKLGRLEKLAELRTGKMGAKQHCWRVRT